MTVDWQLLLVIPIVAVAVCYLARQTWRTWSGKKSGCRGCGCKASPAAQGEVIPVEQLTVRGQQPGR